MNKKGVSLAILIFAIASIILLGLSLVSFYLRDRDINENLRIYNDVDKISLKKIQLDYFLEDVFERSFSEGNFENAEDFVVRFRNEFFKLNIKGFEEVGEYISGEDFIKDVEFSEEKLKLKFEVELIEVREISTRYDYSKVFEKTFKV